MNRLRAATVASDVNDDTASRLTAFEAYDIKTASYPLTHSVPFLNVKDPAKSKTTQEKPRSGASPHALLRWPCIEAEALDTLLDAR